MSIIPVINARKMLAILAKAGFQITRQAGSHIRLQNSVTQRSTTVPLHAGDLSRGLTNGILRQAGLSNKIFLELLS